MSWRADWIISTEEFFSQSFSLEAGENQIIWHKSLSMSFIKFIFVFIIMKFRLRKPSQLIKKNLRMMLFY